MADNLSQRGGRDRKMIDIDQAHEAAYWSKKFDVTRERLEEAVRAVGPNAETVEQFLKDDGTPAVPGAAAVRIEP